MTQLIVPRTNANDDECTLVTWLVADGAAVEVGQQVVVLETSKAAFEVEANADGLLVQLVAEGETCAVLAAIGEIVADEAARARFLAARAAPAAAAAELIITAAAAALIKARDISMDRVRALGHPVIRLEDIEGLLGAPAEAVGDRGSRHQQAVAKTVIESHQTIPAAFLLIRATATRLVEKLASYRRRTGRYLGFPEVTLKILGEIGAQFPGFFGDPAAARDPNIGLTMDVGRGLVVPVIAHTQSSTLEQIGDAIHDFRDKATRSAFREADFRNAGMSVSLHTERGVLFAIPFIVPGQRCILSVSGLFDELVLDHGAVKTSQYVQLGLSYDHRYVNGFDAMSFLRAIASRIEDGTELPGEVADPIARDPEPVAAGDRTTLTERQLGGWAAELLGVAAVQPTDDLFELGAHSLTLTSLAARIADELGVELPLRVLFDAASLRDLASAVDAARVPAGGRAMRLLLTMNTPYYPFHGGGAVKSNRLLLEALRDRGHEVRAIVPAFMSSARHDPARLVAELTALGYAVRETPRALMFTVDGVEVEAVLDPAELRRSLVAAIEQRAPDAVLVSSEDAVQNLLDAAVRIDRRRVVYLARTMAFLPFGPQAFFPSATRARLLEGIGAIVSVSAWVADYIKRWSGLDAHNVPIDPFGRGPFPDLGRFDAGYVTMVNASAVKGIAIFLALARQLPGVAFAAVPGWGTTADDLAALRAVPNITILEPENDVTRIFEQTRVMLVPSLVEEARGRIAEEAMIHGIPVLASDVGGIRETGAERLPVRPITEFAQEVDEHMLPRPIVPAQDIAPWLTALGELLANEELYRRRSRAGREHALAANAGIEPFERVLQQVAATGR